MSEGKMLFSIENGIGTITLSNPKKKNAFTMEMIDAWAETLVKWRTDPEVQVIVLTGAGKDFCTGVDVTNMGEMAGPVNQKSVLWDRIHRIALTLEDTDKPVIAALNGIAIGAGFDMALMCDLRFAADTAVFSEGYVKAGMVPGDGGAYFLPRLVGIAKALELLWTGDMISAEEALRIGMVNRVYSSDSLMEETYKFAGRLVDGPGTVIRMIKRATYQSMRSDLRTALDLISSHMGVVRETEDSKAAMMKLMASMKKPK